MSYTPDATDVSQPTSDVKASTAAAEFRAIKEYIRTLVVGAINAGPGTRQVALIGSQDANGDPNFLSAGTGLALNLAATAAPLCLTYAGGSDANGDVNYSEQISADVASVVSALPPSNLSYITKLLGGAWGSTLAPCQYGKVFDKAAQILVRWPGDNNAIATTEDFGNTCTFLGNAKLSTAVQILGQNTLACDGTSDGVTLPFTGAGADSWELFFSFRTGTFAAAQAAVKLTNAGGLGALCLLDTAGRISYYLSSDGTSWNVAAGTVGAVLAINTTYYCRLSYDAVSDTYRSFISNDGGAESLDFSTVSINALCPVTLFCIGCTEGAGASFNGNLGAVGFRRFVSFTSAQAVGPTVAPTFASVAAPFFNTLQMKMYDVTAASTVAGTNPELTAVNKLYLGEAITSGAAVTSVVNYAYKARYDKVQAVVAGTLYNIATNVGAPTNMFLTFSTRLQGVQGGFNEEAPYGGDGSGANANFRGALFGQKDRNTHRVRTQDVFQIMDVAGSSSNPSTGFVRVSGERRW